MVWSHEGEKLFGRFIATCDMRDTRMLILAEEIEQLIIK